MPNSMPTEYTANLCHLAAYKEPTKVVKCAEYICKWLRSEAYYDILGFVVEISEAIQGIKCTDNIYISDSMCEFLKIFDKLNDMIDLTPPLQNAKKNFGDTAYRGWSNKMDNDIYQILSNALPSNKCHAVHELGWYLSSSFGNAPRMDYGTGHELSFTFFMCALFKANLLQKEDKVACALVLFNKYLQLVRRLQQTYKLQAIGSNGVYSLDDYHFLGYIWGSAQLSLASPFAPCSFLDNITIEKYKNDYLFLGCIDYIRQRKPEGHFAEHSYQLWCITAVKNWPKLNAGLLTMYQEEILSRYSIMQHMSFGELLTFKTVKPGTQYPTAQLGLKKSSVEIDASDASRSNSSGGSAANLKLPEALEK